jgi:hypothetical protein
VQGCVVRVEQQGARTRTFELILGAYFCDSQPAAPCPPWPGGMYSHRQPYRTMRWRVQSADGEIGITCRGATGCATAPRSAFDKRVTACKKRASALEPTASNSPASNSRDKIEEQQSHTAYAIRTAPLISPTICTEAIFKCEMEFVH